MKIRTDLIIAGVVLGCLLPPTQISGQEASVTIEVLTTFEYPNASTATYPQKINNAGDVAGYFIDVNGADRGFVRFSDGTFSEPIAEPNDNLGFTVVTGINNLGALCGVYETGPDFVIHGFFLSDDIFTEFDVAGAHNTWLEGINDAGNFCGYTESPDISGFVNIDGSTTFFDVLTAQNTLVMGMNNLNQCVGTALSGIHAHGFLRDPDGSVTFPIDVPRATVTIVNGINDRGWMVGEYQLKGSRVHAVFFQSPTKFIVFDYPGAEDTTFKGINEQGLICGFYNEGSGETGVGIVAHVSRGAGK